MLSLQCQPSQRHFSGKINKTIRVEPRVASQEHAFMAYYHDHQLYGPSQPIALKPPPQALEYLCRGPPVRQSHSLPAANHLLSAGTHLLDHRMSLMPFGRSPRLGRKK